MNNSMIKIREDLKDRLDEKRYYHTLGVMDTACCLAMCHGEDISQAMMAGLLHDCAKYGSTEKMISKCEKYGISLDPIERINPSLIHAKLGAYYAQKRYNVLDEQILSAIRKHTTGSPEMTRLEQIIFLADFIEPGRVFTIGLDNEGLDRIRRICFQDLNRGVYEVSKVTLDYLKETKPEEFISDTTRRTYEYYADLCGNKE